MTAIDCHRRSEQRAEQRAARLEKEQKKRAAIWRAGEEEERGLVCALKNRETDEALNKSHVTALLLGS